MKTGVQQCKLELMKFGLASVLMALPNSFHVSVWSKGRSFVTSAQCVTHFARFAPPPFLREAISINSLFSEWNICMLCLLRRKPAAITLVTIKIISSNVTADWLVFLQFQISAGRQVALPEIFHSYSQSLQGIRQCLVSSVFLVINFSSFRLALYSLRH